MVEVNRNRHYTNDNVGLYYEEAGTGLPIVLIPGATASIAWWRKNFNPLSEQFRVFAVDMRGFGQSDPSPWGQNCARYAMDMLGLIEDLDLEDVTLVGWSCGARTIYTYAMLHGNYRLRAAVLVDDTVHHTVHDRPQEDSLEQPDENEIVYRERTLRNMVSPLKPATVSKDELNWMMTAVEDVPEALFMDGRAQDFRPLCPRIDLPVLLASGRHSGALIGCQYAADHIPGARLEIFEESQHIPFYTEPDKFNRVVADFVTNPRL